MRDILLSTYFKPDDKSSYAEVWASAYDGPYIKYYENNSFIISEEFPAKGTFYAEDAAEDWAQGIKDTPKQFLTE